MPDLVPNHTSDRHLGFVESRAARTGPRRDWYVWADPAPDGGPPNNWLSAFAAVGPAWTLDPTTGQYYLHWYTPQQPDLNWRSPAGRSGSRTPTCTSTCAPRRGPPTRPERVLVALNFGPGPAEVRLDPTELPGPAVGRVLLSSLPGRAPDGPVPHRRVVGGGGDRAALALSSYEAVVVGLGDVGQALSS